MSKIFGAKGLAWIKINDISQGRNGLQSPIVKNIDEKALDHILEKTKATTGDNMATAPNDHLPPRGAKATLDNQNC